MSTGKTLRTLREAAGISQAAAAELAGVEARTWQRWEADRHPPRREVVVAFAAAAGVALAEDELVVLSGEETGRLTRVDGERWLVSARIHLGVRRSVVATEWADVEAVIVRGVHSTTCSDVTWCDPDAWLSPGLVALDLDDDAVLARITPRVERILLDAHLERSNRGAEEERDGICPRCNGSGEGMYDGSSCLFCRGSGSTASARAAQERDDAYADSAYDAWKERRHETD